MRQKNRKYWQKANLKLLHIEYVRRLTYTDIPGVKKGGVRFMILMIF